MPLLLAAQWVSGDIYGEQMPAIAADLLEAGYDTPSLRRLAGDLDIHNHADAATLVEKVIRELGIGPISENQAKLIATRQIAREVIAGKRDPYAAASHLEIVLWNRKPFTPDLENLFSFGTNLNGTTLRGAMIMRSTRTHSKPWHASRASLTTKSPLKPKPNFPSLPWLRWSNATTNLLQSLADQR